jgi:hypothetical protein
MTTRTRYFVSVMLPDGSPSGRMYESTLSFSRIEDADVLRPSHPPKGAVLAIYSHDAVEGITSDNSGNYYTSYTPAVLVSIIASTVQS